MVEAPDSVHGTDASYTVEDMAQAGVVIVTQSLRMTQTWPGLRSLTKVGKAKF